MRHLVLLLLAATSTASAATWTVDDDGPADFTSINDAIQAASNGDTIQVAAGVYEETYVYAWATGILHIDRSVTIVGAGPGRTVVRQAPHSATHAGAITTAAGTWNAVIEGMTLINDRCGSQGNNAACTAVFETDYYNVTSGSLDIQHVVFQLPLNRAKAIHYRNNAGLAVTYDHVTVDFGDERSGDICYTNRGMTNSVFRNGIVINGNTTCEIHSGSALPFRYTVYDGPSAPSGTGNFVGQPTFVDRDGGDYSPAPGSVAIDAGAPAETDADGSVPDLGAYFRRQLGCPANHPEVERNGVPVCLHAGALVDPSAAVGELAVIGDGAFIAPRAVIGEGAEVGAGSTIARRAQIDAFALLGTGVTIGRNARIFGEAELGNGVVIGYGSQVQGHAELGANVLVGNLVTIEASAAFDDGVIARNSRIGSGTHLVGPNIIGPEVEIGANVQGLGALTVRKNSTLDDDSVLGDGARIGRNSEVQGVNIGGNAVLRADVCAGEDVPADTVVPRSSDTCTP